MNNLLRKVTKLLLGLSLAAGVGVAIGSKAAERADADGYTITFSTGSGDGTSASTSTACADIVSAGSSYLSGNLATATKVYYSGDYGLKLGASSSSGTLKMNLANDVTPTSVVVNAKLYNSGKAATLSVNGSATQSITSDFSDLTFSINSSISYLQLVSSKYCWISSITVNTSGSGGGDPTPANDTYSMSGKSWVIKTGSYYLKNDVSTTSKPSVTTSKSDAAVFTFTLGTSDDTFTLASADDVGKYLSSNSGTGDKIRLNASSMVWTLETVSGSKYLKNSYGNYLECYNSADWRAYSSKTQADAELTFEEVTIEPTVTGVSITGSPSSEMGTGSVFTLNATVAKKFDPNSTLSVNVSWSVSPSGAVSFSSATTASGVDVTVTAGNNAAQNVVITATSVADNTKTASTSAFTIIKSYTITRVDLVTSDGQTSYNANNASSKVVTFNTAIVYDGDQGEGALSITSTPATHVQLSSINNGTFTATFTHNGIYTIKSEAVENTNKYATLEITITGIPFINTSGLVAGTYFIKANTDYYLTGITGGEGDTSLSSADGLLFTFSLVDDDTWTIVNNDQYLYITGTSSTNLGLSNSEQTLTVSAGSEQGTYKIHNATRALAWYATNESIRTYALSNATDFVLEIDDGKTSVILNASDINMETGDDDIAPTVTRTDTGAAVTGYTLTSSDTDVVTIVNNKVHAVGGGTAIVTVSKEATQSEKYVHTTFEVTVVEITNIETFYTDLDTNKTYTYRGTVIGIEGNSYYLQQGQYGILIYGGTTEPPTGMKVGDLVEVTSKVQNYKGNVIENSGGANTATIVGTGTLPAAPIVTSVSGFNSANQSTRVTFNGLLRNDSGATITWTGTWSYKSADQSATVKDSSGATITLYVSRYLDSSVASAIISKINTITVDDTFDLFQGVKVVNANDGTARLSVMSADNITIHTPDEDHVQNWIDTYLFMDDPNFEGNGTGLCLENNYYVNAKAALNALESEHEGCKASFQSDNSYSAALARYLAWAAACHDSQPFVGSTIQSVNSNTIIGVTNNNTNTIAIIVIISLVSVTAIGGYFFIKRREEN